MISLIILDVQTDKSARIVCYCAAGYRSSLIVEKLQDHFKKLGMCTCTSISMVINYIQSVISTTTTKNQQSKTDVR